MGVFERTSNTWVGHALLSVFGSLALVVLASIWLGFLPPMTVMLFGSAFWFGFYVVKELADENRHRKLGDWRVPAADGVRPLEDKVGDLVGPGTCFVTTLVCWVLWLL